jgi:hypothetical protein
MTVKIATSLASQRGLWEPLVSYDPVARYYVRLAGQQDFEAWLLTWLPGQGTDWRDHGGSAGAFITLRGVLKTSGQRPSGTLRVSCLAPWSLSAMSSSGASIPHVMPD